MALPAPHVPLDLLQAFQAFQAFQASTRQPRSPDSAASCPAQREPDGRRHVPRGFYREESGWEAHPSRWPGSRRSDLLRLPRQELLVLGAQVGLNQF